MNINKYDKIKGGPTLFMNPTRQRIYQYLSLYPCSHLNSIARGLAMTLPTARWHLTKMEAADFISKRSLSNKLIYFPKGMVKPEHAEILAFLNREKGRRLFNSILESPGLSQKELCRHLDMNSQTLVIYAKNLEKFELITTVEDGKFKRYYPTKKYEELRDENLRRLKQFREQVVEALKRDGVNPEIVRTTDKELHIKVISGTERSILVVYTNPFATMLAK